MARTAPVPNIPPIPGMCPSVAVMGGGGGGGGGSGNGAGDGSGDGSGAGDGNGDGANGDGTGSGSCGNGSAGSCTNCSSGTSAGDPVDVVTGEVFTLPKTDLFLPGVFNVQIDRSYSSFNRKQDVGLGWGWNHTFAWEMRIRRDRITVRSGRGQTVELPRIDEPGEETGVQGWGLLRTAEGYWLRPDNEFHHFFAADEDDPTILLLRSITYRGRGRVRFEYRDKKLVRMIDTVDRAIVLARNPEGRISSLTVPEPGGGAIVFARYLYDGAGHLVSAEDADGHRWRYAYDDDRRLIEMELPTGAVFHFRYDLQGRCVETWGDEPAGVPSALSPDLATHLADGVTKARGIYHAKIDFVDAGYSEVVDSVRTLRVFADEGGVVCKNVNGRGGVTTRQLDGAGNIISQTDAGGGEWGYAYDKLGNVVERRDPEGNIIRYKRDHEGRIVQAMDPAGGIVDYGRDRYGEIEWIRDPKGGVSTFRHDARGLLSEHRQPDGTSILFEHDAFANVSAIHLPNGGTYRFQHDYWGRQVREVEPDGQSYVLEYTPSGKISTVTDRIGRSQSVTYDGLGNVTSRRMPDGSVYHYTFGGLGWLTAIRHPNGDVLRGFFNREGWLVRVENEKGERLELERDANGQVVGEKRFDGTWRRLKRDAMGHVIAITDPTGTTEISRNKLGQAVEIAGPSGEQTKLAYDARGEVALAVTDGVALAFQRDPLGAIVAERVTVGDEDPHVVENARDIMGRRIALSTTAGHAIEARRDSLGRVVELVTDGRTLLRFGRDAIGWPVRRDLAGGASIVDEIDPVGHLSRRVVTPAGTQTAPDGKPDWVGAPPPGAIDKSYQYSPVGEIVSVTTAADGTVEMEYDLRRHLLARRGRKVDERFDYDATCNPHEVGANAAPRRYGPGGRLIERGPIDYDYDERGRIIRKRVRKDDGTVEMTTYTYDAWDWLRRIDLPDAREITFKYDSFARRVEKRVARRLPTGKSELLSKTRYLWDAVTLIQEITTEGDAPPRTVTYVFEDNNKMDPVAQTDGAGRWLYHVADPTGAPEELIDDKGNVVARSTRTAYGRWSWATSSNATTAFRFLGQIEDAESGLHYNRYRYYDPDTGRYLTPDPIGLDGGPHLYQYGPNPVGWTDPMGWQHNLEVRGFTDSTGGPIDLGGATSWVSGEGTQHGTRCPAGLRGESRAHSERRLLHHLETNPETRDRLQGANLQLHGELPPCLNCHRAMHDFAQRHGTTIQYSYGSQTVTYTPGSQPSASGRHATAMVHGTTDPNRPHYGDLDGPLHPVGTGPGGRRGSAGTAGAEDRYSYGGHGAPAAYTREADRVDPSRPGAAERRANR